MQLYNYYFYICFQLNIKFSPGSYFLPEIRFIIFCSMKKNILLLYIAFLLLSINLRAQDARVQTMTRHCEISDNKLIETDTITFLVFNRNGEEHTQISIPYSKMAKVSDINGWMEDANGNKIRILRNTDITDASYTNGSTLYQDEYIKTLTLKHNVYPYKVTYTYRTTQKQFLDIADWSPVYHYAIPTDKAVLSVKTPVGYPIQFTSKDIISHTKDSVQEQIRHTWTAAYATPVPVEKYSISRREMCPFVKVIPRHFTYGVDGDFTTWASFGSWYWQLTSGLNDLSPQDKTRIEEITHGVSDKKEIVRIIYHYMQDQTRYINISLGIGGMKPYPASYVSANKYGDCKALSNYMKSLLEVVGIPSYLTVIEGNPYPGNIMGEFPSQQFNHAILTVPLGKDTLYLENTSNIHPFGCTGTFIQNRKALLINGKESKLIRIPAMTDEQVTNNRTFNITFNKSGNAEVELKFRFRGYNFDQFNSLKADYSQDFQDRQVRENIPLSNYEVINWDLSKPDRDSAFITLSSRVILYKYLKPIGNEFYFSLLPISTFGFETPESRTLPVALPFPIVYSDTINFVFPEGYKLKTLPETQTVQSGFGKCNLRYMDKRSGLTLVRDFNLHPGIIEKKEYESFYAFLNNIAESDRKKIVITTE